MSRHKYVIAAAAAILYILSLTAWTGATTGQAGPRPLEPTARAFVEQVHKGDFAKATQNFDAAMLQALPPNELGKFWEVMVVGKAGAFKKVVGTRVGAKDGFDLVYVTCEFDKGRFDLCVGFDADGKIAGLTAVTRTPSAGPEEIYLGTLQDGDTKIRLAFHLFRQKDGSYEGTMDSLDEGAVGLPLDVVRVKDGAVRLEYRPAGIVFEGKRGEDGREIAGTYQQAGDSLPLTLTRVTAVPGANRPQHPQRPYPYDEIEVSYENRLHGVTLAGTLTVPRGEGPFPAVLLITGSGAQDRDETMLGHKPFLVLADYLTRRGIAVLRVDDRGVGGSTGSVSESTTADFAEDVLAGVAFLKGRKEINPAQIGLIGHSEGGAIAPLVAGRSKDVAFIVMLAGPGMPGHEVLRTQSAAGLKLGNAPPEAIDLLGTLQDHLFAAVRTEKDLAVAKKQFRAALAEVTAQLSADRKQRAAAALAVIEAQAGLVLSPWGRYFTDYDPRPALHRVTCPVLALNGSKDVQVDAKINLSAIEAALTQAGNPDVTIRALPGLNHLFQTCRTGATSEYATIEETLAPVVLETVADWIAQHTGPGR
jgi:pimeloyl-ACP methyl ester carboxylesterase